MMTPPRSLPSLTIGIPTYNRPEALSRRIFEIQNFAHVVDQIVIYDNSDESYPQIKDAINASKVECNYSRNKVNIGAGANFLRILENSSTDYLWWRGDDDVISSEQVSAVGSYLTNTTPRFIVLNNLIDKPLVGKGVDEYVSNFDKLASILWSSMLVVPVEVAKKAMPNGYYAIDWAHVAVVNDMFRLMPDLEFVVVPFELQTHEFRDTGRVGQAWDLFRLSFVEFPRTANVFKSASLQYKYINSWRKSKKFSLIRQLIGIKLGIAHQERLTFSLFTSLMSISNPRSTMLGVVMFTLSRVPSIVYQIAFSVFWITLSTERKRTYNVPNLMSKNTFLSVFKALREMKKDQNDFSS